ncbi:unnamed protein product [Brassica oleracea var. botrytis]|uniref:BnaCnng12700D protein n=4 Tax=Brassica TaxID=3705 RepID=A0A078I6L2_BRANA|nr:unnamed protein product [Brassica napus]CDY45511.1 BnaCnng12700D [Brassica napus]VDD25064.1 unnamed protein product [Brassica rapa]VDD27126.1 unnamed protein product [Brassica rapa]VDD65153.1 unnamed protein product [Brassica oleracea]
MLSISQKGIAPPAMLPRPAYRGIEREDRGGPEQVGLGYRAVSAVGCERGRARALRSAAQMVSYEVSIGLILIVRLVSAFVSAKAIIARMSGFGRAALSDQEPGHKGPGTIPGAKNPGGDCNEQKSHSPA